ncbi:hypothetical protein CHN50_03600 [Priestia aryabhattai]|uniref:hypothetical protein n=1 Tax=Bacillus sp. CBEL-1 TaxID=2502980 RepID=UPI000B9FED67|nr:hypothetical protein [Bacillus sp. CBEL-1]OZT13671.1 hypothetical protein CHN50_03600 [Priestia aryabhattai]TDB49718.1 hypothetical protein EPL02_11520 [Bacillus sp. CBEL-1]
MKKWLVVSIGLIGIVMLALVLPRLIGSGVHSLNSSAEQKVVDTLEKNLRVNAFRTIDRVMVQGYEIKPNGHQLNNMSTHSIKNYQVRYYTFFGLPYGKAEMSKEGSHFTKY